MLRTEPNCVIALPRVFKVFDTLLYNLNHESRLHRRSQGLLADNTWPLYKSLASGERVVTLLFTIGLKVVVPIIVDQDVSVVGG